MKRKQIDISEDFLQECEKKFKDNPVNLIARNAVTAVGSMLSTTNADRVNDISHVFLNSVKKRHLRATNQGASGRCWMFAGLNTFRHILINSLGLENFEFSETYLFFWDKLERANSYLRWFIDHPEYGPEDKEYQYMLENYMSDGGWWNTFANLVNKYGLVPISAMKETYQSDDSEAMNAIIAEHLDSCVNFIRKNRHKLNLEKVREETLTTVYNILVKFLGQPPVNFNWTFQRDDEEGGDGIVSRLNPFKFRDMVAPEMSLSKDFVVLAHIPTDDMCYYTKYRIRYTNNVDEGDACTFFNVPIQELTRYALKSISGGFAVWFVGDVMKHFNWFHSALDDNLNDHKTVFGETHKFDKGDRITLRNVQGTHAMALSGFNLDEKGRPINWQVENSWGYVDNETPGLDGFLNMSHSWFEKYVTQIAIHKDFLSRTMQKKMAKADVVEINPWESVAPALRSGPSYPPKNYLKVLAQKAPGK